MNARLLSCLLVVCLGTWMSACFSEPSTPSADPAAEALAYAMQFQNGTVIEGEFPEADPGSPATLQGSGVSGAEGGRDGEAPRVDPDDGGDGDEPTLTPGMTSVLSILVDNSEAASDPVVATLVGFEGATGFIVVPTATDQSEPGPSQINNTFTVDPSICDDLCNIIHQVMCYEAAQTASGLVTKANLRSIAVDCQALGNESSCASAILAPPPIDIILTCSELCMAVFGEFTLDDALMECVDGWWNSVTYTDGICDVPPTEIIDNKIVGASLSDCYAYIECIGQTTEICSLIVNKCQ